MATLVLTAVGSAIGGPIGGALGALAGNALDHALFAPKGRDGARLSDLRVQTSTYGAAIARVFGTMRVAGTVIWSTDLHESRSSSRARKGQPSVTSYSYSVSFAVLLSGRPIAGVGRIWADGQLLRGAAGDWKAPTGFRLHGGGEDQPVDPLIASAEGAALTPAHRGCAYAVFEGLQLASFGNRLPSLSFEVIADAGPVTTGTIAAELADEVVAAPGLPLDGWVAAGGTVRDALDGLATASGAWFAPDGRRLALRDTAVPALAVVADPAQDGREMAAADRAAALVSVRYFDPGARLAGGIAAGAAAGAGPATALDLPAAMSAAAAKGVAVAALARGEAGRVRRTLSTGPEGLALVPGDAVTIVGETGVWRIEAVTLEGTVLTLVLVPHSLAPLPAAASAGRALPVPDRVAGLTLLHVAELPGLADAPLEQPRLTVWATGTGAGWRAAALLISQDGGASWTDAGATAAAAIVGSVEVAPGIGAAVLVDRRNSLIVRLARDDLELADATPGRLDAGANLALVGGELLQFGRAESLGARRWRLSELWRGRRGTQGAPPVVAGDRFVLVEADTSRTVDLPLSALGSEVRVMASGVGDAEPAAARVAVTGASVLPPAPVALHRDGDTIRWTRRSRAGWRWLDRVDVPLGEDAEAYRVTVTSGGVVRETVSAVPWLPLSGTEVASGGSVTVRQRGTFGESLPATLIF